MNKLRHAVAAVVFFAIMVGLFVTIYDLGLVENYGVIEGDLKPGNFTEGREDQNIMEQFQELNLIQGIVLLNKGVTELNPGVASTFDILGGLASVGVGTLRVVVGLLTAPYSIVRIILMKAI